MINYSRPMIFLLIIVLALLCYFVPFKPISILAAMVLAILAIWIITEKKHPGFTNKVLKNFGKTTIIRKNNIIELTAPTANVVVKPSTDAPFALIDGEEIPLNEDISIERDSKNLRHITIYIPSNIDSIKLSLVSGDLDASLFNVKNIDSQSVSGNVKLSDIKGSVVKAKSVSGDVELNNISCVDATAFSTSGDIEIKKSRLKNIKTSSISGDVELMCDFDNCDLSTTSGDVDIVTEDKGYSLSIQSTSGSWTIFDRNGVGQYKENGREGYSIKASTLSGTIKVTRE